MGLLSNYTNAKMALYDHVGFVEDWVFYPIDDCTDMWWSILDEETIKYAGSIDKYRSDGDYYTAEIYHQRFYKKWVYEGEKLTMVFLNPGVDGMKYFAFFDNSKKIQDENNN